MVTPLLSPAPSKELFLLDSTSGSDLLCLQYALRGPLPLYGPVHVASKAAGNFAQMSDAAQFWRLSVKGSLPEFEFLKVGAPFSVAPLAKLGGDEDAPEVVQGWGFQCVVQGSVELLQHALVPFKFFYDRAPDALSETLGFDFAEWKAGKQRVVQYLLDGAR